MELPHTYIIGQSGSGKSTLLKTDILDRIHAGDGLLYLDPHGDDTDDLLDYIPARRRDDVILFDPTTFPLPWNPLGEIDPTIQPFVASAFVDTMKAAWGYAHVTTPTMDLYLYFSIASLMATGGTLADVPALLTDHTHRATVTAKLTDTVLRDFWVQFDNLSGKEQRDATSSTLNKLWVLCGDPRIRQVIGSQRSSFRMDEVLAGKIFFARLPQGKLGIGKAALIGSLLLSQAHLAALSRSPAVPFHFFIDEGHQFAPSTIAEMLSGLRKFGCRVVLAHQYVAQLDRQLFTALLGNCPVRHVFRVSREDAAIFAKEQPPNSSLPNLDEMPPHTYRTFPFTHYRSDATLRPLDQERFPKSRSVIEANMRRNYMRG
jgi:type IV secretory pathway TraG/TraD family ATPase VirD4